jgi:hypothetical protein
MNPYIIAPKFAVAVRSQGVEWNHFYIMILIPSKCITFLWDAGFIITRSVSAVSGVSLQAIKWLVI